MIPADAIEAAKYLGTIGATKVVIPFTVSTGIPPLPFLSYLKRLIFCEQISIICVGIVHIIIFTTEVNRVRFITLYKVFCSLATRLLHRPPPDMLWSIARSPAPPYILIFFYFDFFLFSFLIFFYYFIFTNFSIFFFKLLFFPLILFLPCFLSIISSVFSSLVFILFSFTLFFFSLVLRFFPVYLFYFLPCFSFSVI